MLKDEDLKNDKIKMIVRENEPYLNALEELDRTGKLRKPDYKERVNFTIDALTMNTFRKHCEKNSISMSSKVEKLIKEYLLSVDKGG
ncbi:MAG: hypothetical protein KKF44_00625 [Nanoarchaeota archaeon]|nr:hypothetical protein [Nanoarchaeota archaeon]